MIYFQQGDVLIKPCGKFDVFEKEFFEIPKDALKQKSNLALRGATNSHAFYGGEFEIFEKDSVKFVRVKKPCILDHVKSLETMERAEHNSIEIPIGDWFIEQVNEYDHLAEESRKIID